LAERPPAFNAANKPPVPESVGYVPAAPIVTEVAIAVLIEKLLAPVTGKAPTFNATVGGGVVNVPILIPRFGVPARSWATTKYSITEPDPTPPKISEYDIVKLKGLDAFDASTYFHPSVVLSFVPGSTFAFVDFLYHRRGFVPGATLTPDTSVITTGVNVGSEVQSVFGNVVYTMVGAAKSPAASYAPIVGVVTLLVAPRKSVVIPAIGVPAATKGEPMNGIKLVVEL
jgi:hypothetical protein